MRSRTQPSRKQRSLTAPEGNSPSAPPEYKWLRARLTPMILTVVAAVRSTPVGVTEMNEEDRGAIRPNSWLTISL